MEHIPIEKLEPDARNARQHTENQVQQIAESIKAFGWTNPILIDERNQIVAGHGRFAAAKLLGSPKVPCLRITGLTSEQLRAYVIADNKLAQNSSWDEALLAQEMAALKELINDVSIMGFTQQEIDSLLAIDASNNPVHEWQGMPEFKHEDKESFQKVIVHFKNQADVDKFAALVAQPITPKTRSIWYPEAEIDTYADKRYKVTAE